jgi:hypothetical protein
LEFYSKDSLKFYLITLISLIVVGTMYYQPTIEQDILYHSFSDQRTIFGIPNFWNVVSNLPFLFVGLYSMVSIYKHYDNDKKDQCQPFYYIFFIGITSVSFGSGYYHLWPSNSTLVWNICNIQILLKYIC